MTPEEREAHMRVMLKHGERRVSDKDLSRLRERCEALALAFDAPDYRLMVSALAELEERRSGR